MALGNLKTYQSHKNPQTIRENKGNNKVLGLVLCRCLVHSLEHGQYLFFQGCSTPTKELFWGSKWNENKSQKSDYKIRHVSNPRLQNPSQNSKYTKGDDFINYCIRKDQIYRFIRVISAAIRVINVMDNFGLAHSLMSFH